MNSQNDVHLRLADNIDEATNHSANQKQTDGDDQRHQFLSENGNERLSTYPMGWRHVVSLIAFIGFICMYTLRINMSVALVAMVNRTTAEAVRVNESQKITLCKRPHEVSSRNYSMETGKYLWNSETQGLILSSFFYGYIMTQFAGGILAGKYGAKWVFGIGNLLTAVFALLSPAAAEIGLKAFVTVRILQGVCSGVTWPSMEAFFARWAPPSERSTLPAFAYAGSFVGTPLTFLLSGVLADSGFMGGWPSIFYVFGIVCCVWFVFWIVLSSSGPENHRFISRGEQAYITKALIDVNVGQSNTSLKDVPWASIFSSSAVWAVIVSHFTYTWGLYVLMANLPIYFNEVQGFDIKKNGLLSALPYMVQFFVHILSAWLADYLRVRFRLKTVHVRKAFDCLGHLLSAICATCLAFVGCNEVAAVSLLILTIGFTGLCASGWFVNFLDIAPRYASILLGVSNTFGTLPGILGPHLARSLTSGNTFGGWRMVFLIMAALYAFSAVFFFIFGQGSQQAWAAAPGSKLASQQTEKNAEKSTTKV